jgi:hypothetical protein
VSQKQAKKPVARAAVSLGLALASLLAAGRVVQLAASTSAAGANTASQATVESAAPAQSAETAKTAQADAELAELYHSCPMAAVIDLKTVVENPARVDQLLPPYKQMVHRVPDPPVEPAIPRIRYPISVRAESPRAAENPAVVHVAEAPHPATADKVLPSESSPAPSQQAAGEWLVDPKEWLTSGSAAKTESKPPADDNAKPASPQPTTTEQQQPATTAPPQSDSPVAPPTDTRSNPAVTSPEPVPTEVSTPTPPPAPVPSTTPSASAPTPAEPVKPIFSAPPPIGELPSPHPQHGAAGTTPSAADKSKPCVDPHLELFTKNNYPSARECAQCHEEIYKDWSISAHAYAAVSPMFNKFEQKLNDLSQGTVGYFCMRCHAPVATALCASRAEPLWNLPETAREGITCIACHRVQYAYGKSNGERRIETGDIFAPVLGGIDGDGVAQAIQRKEQLKIKTSPDDKGPGQNMHATGVYFQTLTKSEFCTPCHQVAVQPGIKLEVVWEQYRASPACKKGIQCQDCHMGKVPGLPLGYDCGPVAKIGDKTVNDNRKKSNHIFYGPNYPIAHPGVFPFNLKANRWTMEQWLTFDWRAGWGTKEFEKAVADGQVQAIFPPVWAETDDRCDAREIIDENLKKIEHKRDLRVQVMENGSHVDGPFFDSKLCRGQDLNFHYVVTNTNDGHNLLTASLGAQPQLWANVVLIGPGGQRLWETGYTDSSNDVCNIHSDDVRKHRAPYDAQLFNLQTMFLIQGATGTDREFYVPVNFDTDQLPFIRPGVQPISTINHPPGIRMESRSLAPLGSREARFHVPGELLKQPGTYRLAFRLRSRSEPIYFMRFCEATAEMERAENEWMIDIHPMTVEFVVR